MSIGDLCYSLIPNDIDKPITTGEFYDSHLIYTIFRLQLGHHCNIFSSQTQSKIGFNYIRLVWVWVWIATNTRQSDSKLEDIDVRYIANNT